ncbi:MAG: excinuclease ABC subunit UvrC, partial [candidate division Zixibacteria bacterium]|nr:excinuclease ABC subunit UvrC [candidate division Zixibacteria bacterium]
MAELSDKLEALPDRCGVYLFKDPQGEIIYVGKAKNLRSRVRSYFREGEPDHPRTARLVEKVADVEIFSTDSEVEALILEANLIKEHKPRYNVSLKDDKRYPYIKVTTNEPFPRMLVVRRMRKDGARYFGPYTQVRAMRQTIKTLGRVFQIRACNLVIPSPTRRQYRVCLDYYIKRCPGPCEDKISREGYRELIDSACLFLEGREGRLIEGLTARMDEAAAAMRYEEAAAWRDKLRAVESVRHKQKVTTSEQIDRDVIALARSERIVAAVALQVRDGILIGRQSFQLQADPVEDDADVLTAFLKQYYLHSPSVPDEIYLPFRCTDEDLIASWLSRDRPRAVHLLFPQRGTRFELLEMAQTNVRLSLNEMLTQKAAAAVRIPDSVYQLQRDLRLGAPPRAICAFDVSNLGETDPVGSLVYFKDGQPLKRNYRQFKIKTVIGRNDFAMIGELASRYFGHLVEEGVEFPDLVLIDGGAGQLGAALRALEALNITNLPVIGLAKRLEQVVLPAATDGVGPTLSIPKSSPSLRLLQRIRDEAHRFALTFQKERRKKRVIRSELDRVKGIGPARRQLLLTRLGSVDVIAASSLADLRSKGGLDRRTAESL